MRGRPVNSALGGEKSPELTSEEYLEDEYLESHDENFGLHEENTESHKENVDPHNQEDVPETEETDETDMVLRSGKRVTFA